MRRPIRRGFALMLVVILLASLATAWAVAARQASASFAIDRARSARAARDEGAVYVLGRAIALLETGDPPNATDIDPYSCYLTVPTSMGDRTFVATYLRLGDPNEHRWSVAVAPLLGGSLPDPMPATF